VEAHLKILLLYILCLWLPGFSLFRIFSRVKRGGAEKRFSPERRRIYICLFQLIGGMFASMAVFRGARIFLEGPILFAAHVLAFSLIASVLIDLSGEILLPKRPVKTGWKHFIAPSLIALFGAGLFSLVLYLRHTPGPVADALPMEIPFRGEWRVITGGAPEFMNYHHDNPPSQNYAVDFVKTGPEGASRGQPLFAPVGGRVKVAVGDRKEGEWDPPEGNIVIITTRDGTDVWLCHLEEGSVKLVEGDPLEAGDPLAASGASGGADLPHLHLHAEKAGRPVPMLLGKGEIFPIRGDIIRGSSE